MAYFAKMEYESPKEEIVIPVEYFALNRNELQLSSDAKEQKAFEEYSEARQNNGMIRLLVVTIFPLIIYSFIMALLHAKSWYFIGAIVIGIVVIRNPWWIIYLSIKKQFDEGVRSHLINCCAPWLSFQSNMLSILGPFIMGLYLVARVVNGRCTRLDQYHMYGCSSEYDSHALPQEHMLTLMIIPIALSVVVKTIKPPYICLAWFVCVFFMCVSIGISNSYMSVPALVMYIPSSLAILYEDNRQSIILYLALRKQQSLFEEKKSLSEEAQTELRFMIANMAHDLKTVSHFALHVLNLIYVL